MSKANTLKQFLEQGREEVTAFQAAGREPLTYGRFRDHLEKTVDRLNQFGVGRHDLVAMVVPGPELAWAFVSIAAGAELGGTSFRNRN